TPDYFPTIAEICGATIQNKSALDGESLVPLLRQSSGLKRDAIYWHYPHYHPGGATPYSAVREGDFKLIEFFEDEHVELYNLREDLSEQTDLAAKLPEKANALLEKLHAWRQTVGAQLPIANPKADPQRDK
ncbi:MAG TPA: DUF4976 domain-containing protein, partial [Blastocatellia bacterium]|nr:DUF4976 domain-containing protein [Blastocatellia bacterium]